MQTKFEQLLDYLVNEETDKANELFHQIVVEKSRGIYESLIAEEEAKDKEEEKDKEEQTEESFGMGEESVIEIGGDKTDDVIGDVEFGDDGLGDEGDEMGDMDDMGAEFGDEGEEEGTDARIDDLEDALAELKAEFEQLMAGEEGEEHMGGDDMGDEEGDEDGEEEEQDEQFIREYTEKVSDGHGAEKKGAGEKNVNAKSPMAGENRMGGTAFKLGAGGEEKGGTQGGLLNPSAKDLNSGNVNKPGGTNAKQFYSKDGKGHGAEKKGSGESAGNTKSPLSPSHAK